MALVSSVVPASLTAARRGKRLGSQRQTALNPHDAQVRFAVSKVDLRNQHGVGVDVSLNAGSPNQHRAGHTQKSASLTAIRNDAEKIFIHVYIQNF